MNNIFYTSRSAIECYQECPRRRYLGYLYQGTGLVQTRASVPLTTGSCVHKGIESLLKLTKHGIIEEPKGSTTENYIDGAVSTSLQEYSKLVGSSGILVGKDENEKFVFAQEQARTEALVRAWAIAELPMIMKYYDIVSVEDEIVTPLAPGVIFQAKVDAILKLKSTSDCFAYSLKTMKRYDPKKTDRTFKYALQTITESWAAQKRLEEINKIGSDFMYMAQREIWNDKKYHDLSNFVRKYMPFGEYTIRGTKHCFLVKGGKAIESEQEQGIYLSDGPLISGYRKPREGWHGNGQENPDWEYAHSYKVPNSNNKSGFGTIGKYYEKFNPWEEMGTKEWIALLNSKVQDHTGQVVPEIQPECGNIIKQQVVTPEETWVKAEEMKYRMQQVIEQEKLVNIYIQGKNNDNSTWGSHFLNVFFPQVSQSCFFPGTCEFTPICHGVDWKGDSVDVEKVRKDPLGSGIYKWRTPHHLAELKQMEEREK